MLFLYEIQFVYEFSQFLNTNLCDRDKGLHNKIQIIRIIFGLCYIHLYLFHLTLLFDGVFLTLLS